MRIFIALLALFGLTLGIAEAGKRHGSIALPQIVALVPTGGSTSGGTVVSIHGPHMYYVTNVLFGATPATSFTAVGPNRVTATSPAGAPGNVLVTVVTKFGTSTAVSPANAFSYTLPPAPTVSAVSPNAGSTAGGDTVTVTGTGFLGASDVAFGATDAGVPTVISPTTLTIASPAASAGVVDVLVTNAGVTSTAGPLDQFTYNATPLAVVQSVLPSNGSTAGGTPIAITGFGFTNATEVDFTPVGGGSPVPGTGLAVNDDSDIDIIAPAGTGTQDITVVVAGTPSTPIAADHFVYQDATETWAAGTVDATGVPMRGTETRQLKFHTFLNGYTLPDGNPCLVSTGCPVLLAISGLWDDVLGCPSYPTQGPQVQALTTSRGAWVNDLNTVAVGPCSGTFNVFYSLGDFTFGWLGDGVTQVNPPIEIAVAATAGANSSTFYARNDAANTRPATWAKTVLAGGGGVRTLGFHPDRSGGLARDYLIIGDDTLGAVSYSYSGFSAGFTKVSQEPYFDPINGSQLGVSNTNLINQWTPIPLTSVTSDGLNPSTITIRWSAGNAIGPSPFSNGQSVMVTGAKVGVGGSGQPKANITATITGGTTTSATYKATGQVLCGAGCTGGAVNFINEPCGTVVSCKIVPIRILGLVDCKLSDGTTANFQAVGAQVFKRIDSGPASKWTLFAEVPYPDVSTAENMINGFRGLSCVKDPAFPSGNVLLTFLQGPSTFWDIDPDTGVMSKETNLSTQLGTLWGGGISNINAYNSDEMPPVTINGASCNMFGEGDAHSVAGPQNGQDAFVFAVAGIWARCEPAPYTWILEPAGTAPFTSMSAAQTAILGTISPRWPCLYAGGVCLDQSDNVTSGSGTSTVTLNFPAEAAAPPNGSSFTVSGVTSSLSTGNINTATFTVDGATTLATTTSVVFPTTGVTGALNFSGATVSWNVMAYNCTPNGSGLCPGMLATRSVAVSQFPEDACAVLFTAGNDTGHRTLASNTAWIERIPFSQWGLTAPATCTAAPPPASPVINSTTPATNNATGGENVQIFGANLSDVDTVNFGDNASAQVTVVSGTEVDAIDPGSSVAGDVALTVASTADGTTSNALTFTYTPSAPSVTSLNPPSGSTTVATPNVTINGSWFDLATGVTFQKVSGGSPVGVARGNWTLVQGGQNSAVAITSLLPRAAGPYYVQVTTAGCPDCGTSPPTPTGDIFTFVANAPMVATIGPNSGPIGTSITISGSNFTGATDVGFTPVGGGTTIDAGAPTPGAVPATTQVVAAPAGGVTGTSYDVQVTAGTLSPISAGDQFTFTSSSTIPSISSVTPNRGGTGGGTWVQINGSGFTGATSVDFGGGGTPGANPASAFYINPNGTQIMAMAPPCLGYSTPNKAPNACTFPNYYVYVTTPAGTNPNGSSPKYAYSDWVNQYPNPFQDSNGIWLKGEEMRGQATHPIRAGYLMPGTGAVCNAQNTTWDPVNQVCWTMVAGNSYWNDTSCHVPIAITNATYAGGNFTFNWSTPAYTMPVGTTFQITGFSPPGVNRSYVSTASTSTSVTALAPTGLTSSPTGSGSMSQNRAAQIMFLNTPAFTDGYNWDETLNTIDCTAPPFTTSAGTYTNSLFDEVVTTDSSGAPVTPPLHILEAGGGDSIIRTRRDNDGTWLASPTLGVARSAGTHLDKFSGVSTMLVGSEGGIRGGTLDTPSTFHITWDRSAEGWVNTVMTIPSGKGPCVTSIANSEIECTNLNGDWAETPPIRSCGIGGGGAGPTWLPCYLGAPAIRMHLRVTGIVDCLDGQNAPAQPFGTNVPFVTRTAYQEIGGEIYYRVDHGPATGTPPGATNGNWTGGSYWKLLSVFPYREIPTSQNTWTRGLSCVPRVDSPADASEELLITVNNNGVYRIDPEAGATPGAGTESLGWHREISYGTPAYPPTSPTIGLGLDTVLAAQTPTSSSSINGYNGGGSAGIRAQGFLKLGNSWIFGQGGGNAGSSSAPGPAATSFYVRSGTTDPFAYTLIGTCGEVSCIPAIGAGNAAYTPYGALKPVGGHNTRSLAVSDFPSDWGTASLAIGGSGTTQLTFYAVQAGPSGNNITVKINAASGAGTVAVTGSDIVITPAAAANSITAIIAQVAASGPAKALIWGANTGTGIGAGTISAQAKASLVGGDGQWIYFGGHDDFAPSHDTAWITSGPVSLIQSSVLSSAVVATGGSGCTNSKQTFTVSGGTNIAAVPAQVTGTPSGGFLIVGSALAINGTTGQYNPVPANPVTLTGGGCGTAPTATISWTNIP
jgi:hypothetical protein